MEFHSVVLPSFKLKKGALHKALGVKQGKKLTRSQLMKAANSENPLMRKRAQFAIIARKLTK